MTRPDGRRHCPTMTAEIAVPDAADLLVKSPGVGLWRPAAAVGQAFGAGDIIGELIEFNLTSYLRTKLDQAKQAVHKLEQVVYEVSIRE